MSHTTRRTLRLLALLQSRQVWTGAELAQELDITVRSVRRDVQRLRDLGYPVSADRGHAGGYRLGQGNQLPPLLLEPDEAVAVGVGLRLASSTGMPGVDKVAARSTERLEQLVHAPLRERIRTIAQAVEVVSDGGPTADVEILWTLSQGISESLEVRMDYVARDHTETRRRVEPYRVLVFGNRWYFFAWDLDRQDWRTFRLDRIQSARLSTFVFQPRPTPNIQDFIQRAVTTEPYHHVVRVRFMVPRAQVEPHLPKCSGILEDDGAQACIWTTGADDLTWLAGFLAAMDHDLRVLEPADLLAAMQDLTTRLQTVLKASRNP
ncbi:helix-turn-helix transcriptional regulator [Kocuria sp.]|uniref:helix-turn-helix transcriptional regulator n=1 Tax=Kocuria sp. TaxID=1871328 RepID=UPI0026E0A6D6|nr:YafY family protein [Kocuria sp.]MDO5618869.1 YafY family protein [Kocuria sp.]